MSAFPQTPRALPDPGKPPQPMKTLDRWDTFLGDVASGMPLHEAMKKCYITRADIETCSRQNALQMQRWNEAQVAGRKRKWNVLQLKEIFGKIAEGMTIKDAQIAVVGNFDPSFSQLIIEDPELHGMYRRALEARALIVGEAIFDIVDDDSNDTLAGKHGDIPNMAAVGRSKLRAETRLRIMAAWNNKIYGEKRDQVNVQVNINHAERLENARARVKDMRDSPKRISREVIDAAFTAAPEAKPPVPAADTDTSWMDEKPAETVWREES